METAGGDPSASEIEMRFELVRRRYGHRLTPAGLEEVRQGVQGIVEAARALRAVGLSGADEPGPPFVPFRAEP
jgi:hypothetical protein